MRHFAAVVLLLCGLTTHNSPYATPMAEEFARWPEVEDIMAQARKGRPGDIVGEYSSPNISVFLAESGRGVLLVSPEGEPMKVARLGRWTQSGAWLHFEIGEPALDRETIPQVILAEMQAFEDDQRELDASGASVDSDAEQDQGSDDVEQRHVQKWLLVPHGEIVMLIEGERLPTLALGWTGSDLIDLHPDLVKGAGASIEEGLTFPLSLGDDSLPVELTRLFNRRSIRAHAVALFDSDRIQWSAHWAQLPFRLDRGELHGVYEGLQMHAEPPHEALMLQVTEVAGDHAIATTSISRFHPDDPLELPPTTLQVASRSPFDKGGTCPLDTSAPVRARITAITPSLDAAVFDDDGFTWMQVDIDQGAVHGLLVGDVLRLEGADWSGEGRVRALDRKSARLLWRFQRIDGLDQQTAPDVGAAVVSPAWQRVEADMFGGLPPRKSDSGG